jgi:lipopolysaccharide export system permease protein
MLFHSTIRKELSRNFGATLVVMVTIVITMMIIRILGHAAQGVINPSEVNLIIGFTMLGHLPTIMTMSLFIATVGTLSRIYLESEMVVWLSSGRALTSFLKPITSFSWPLIAIVSVLVLVIWPWSNTEISELRERFERRGDLERVTPGQFQESANGTKVFFVDKDSVENKTGKNIFIAANENGKNSMTSAKTGDIQLIEDERFLMLQSGQRIERMAGEMDIKVSEFKSYGSRIGQDVKVVSNASNASIATLSLIADPTLVHQGELSWRLGIALAALNLPFLALSITSANPRVGRSGNFALAFFVFMIYYNFINLGNSWITLGKVPLLNYMLMLHGGAFAASFLLLLARTNNWHMRRLLLPRLSRKELA